MRGGLGIDKPIGLGADWPGGGQIFDTAPGCLWGCAFYETVLLRDCTFTRLYFYETGFLRDGFDRPSVAPVPVHRAAQGLPGLAARDVLGHGEGGGLRQGGRGGVRSQHDLRVRPEGVLGG